MTMQLEWKLGGDPLVTIGFAISDAMVSAVNRTTPDLSDLFPLLGRFELRGHIDEEWLIVRFSELLGPGAPSIGPLDDVEIDGVRRLIEPFEPRPHVELHELLGDEWFSFQRFTYIGSYRNSYACWPNVRQHLFQWLNRMVLPEVLRRNERRILRAIPKPPQFNPNIIRACWVLECEETSKQGTAFNLRGTGLVSCSHVLGSKTMAFHPDDVTNKYPVSVVKKHEGLDLAVLSIDHEIADGLVAGTADNLQNMNHVAVAGFPNYNLGDTGIFSPGLVIGFRTVSGIRRILTNAPIIAGMSGGPAVDGNNHVIGIAVTGAEIMDQAQETEKHGIIPIDALQHLTS